MVSSPRVVARTTCENPSFCHHVWGFHSTLLCNPGFEKRTPSHGCGSIAKSPLSQTSGKVGVKHVFSAHD